MGKLGHSSITLTDLTDTLPVSLILESNLDKNIQVKTGNFYEPNFEKEGVVITPSLYLGQEDLFIENNPFYVNPSYEGEKRKSGFIYYEIEDTKYYYNSNTDNKIYVDDKGQLHIKKNLNKNFTIEAYIEDFLFIEHNTTIDLVQATNPINVLFLEEGSNNYIATIECEGGREHFEEKNAANIIMYATLYKGNEILNYREEDGIKSPQGNFSYSWEKLSDGDLENDGKDFSFTSIRKDVINREHYTCIITDQQTGLTYTATQIIHDFTDTYNCDIESDIMPIFTSQEKSIILTAETYYRTEKLGDNFNLSYEWFARGRLSGEEIILKERINNEEINKSPQLIIKNTELDAKLQKQDFIVYCKVYNTDSQGNLSQIAGSTIDIKYSENYNVKVTPQTIFVPTSNSGLYQGDKSYFFQFQILGENGKPVLYDSGTSTITGVSFDDNTEIKFTNQDIELKSWDFIGEIVLDSTSDKSIWAPNSTKNYRAYDFTYTYLGQVFSEEILIVKQPQGEQGFSGYTVDLSNEFHAFPGGDSHADPGSTVSFEICAHYGEKSLPITKVSLSDERILISPDGEKEQIENNIKIEASKKDNNIIITMTTGSERGQYTTKIEPISFYVTIVDVNNKQLTFLKTFSYTITYNGKSYYLITSSNEIIYKSDGSYNPTSISVNASYTETNGSIHNYSEGKIIYSLDNQKSWKFLTTGSAITNYLNLDRIKIRLYSKIATFDSSTNLTDSVLETNAQYLLDVETIPILTSMEGFKIGGENLIRWSKTIPIAQNKWIKTKDCSTYEEADFTVMDFSFSGLTEKKQNSFSTPRIRMTENYYEKEFCFSCLIKINQIENYFLDESFIFAICGHLDNNSYRSFRSCYKHIGYLIDDGIGTMNVEGNWENNKWVKIYKTFKLQDLNDTDNPDGIATPINECDSFSIAFYLEKNGSVQIKQPKLELGNVPSSWSASPYDIDFSDVSGVNLIDPSINTLNFSLNDLESSKLFFSNLIKNNFYTFSWSNIELLGDGEAFLIFIETGGNLPNEIGEIPKYQLVSQGNGSYTFKPENNVDCYILVKNVKIVIQNFKLEKGENSTSYVLTKEQLDLLQETLVKNIQDTAKETQETVYSYVYDAQGNPLYLDQTEVNTLIKNATSDKVTINQYNEGIRGVGTEIAAQSNRIQVIEKSFFLGNKDVDGDGNTEPVLILSTQAGFNNNNYMQLTDSALSFYINNTEVAKMSNMTLEITNAKIKTSLSIGGLKFIPSDTGTALVWEENN